MLGISRTTAYEAVRNGSLPSIRIRRRIVIPMVWINEMFSGHPMPGTNSDLAGQGPLTQPFLDCVASESLKAEPLGCSFVAALTDSIGSGRGSRRPQEDGRLRPLTTSDT